VVVEDCCAGTTAKQHHHEFEFIDMISPRSTK